MNKLIPDCQEFFGAEGTQKDPQEGGGGGGGWKSEERETGQGW